ncbi:EamA family transporter RarD [Desulfoluna spongiiphila]|uniref:Chloramphenicol-sensitive protein RarD n=1 Tax=Desulfoluna spongiiphila TaxID=419481 RepID=A0A1G5FDH3_9BACT|nr:EamA family transporter RarD [Desulfoluna spongiiphila]SCY37227.1 chloramphenicol-sensitive protein RarD [Desulfoluna spongiiphila]VVS95661.1 rard protein [Desulfoluna spongiiphila]
MPSRSETATGLLVTMQAFLIWGLSPIYWNHISHVPAFETLMHRVVWSLAFLLPILIFQKKMGPFFKALTNLRTMAVLTLTTCLVGGNWFLFIWSINHGHVMQTSLGYYINPLVTVFLGMIFLKEKLTARQKVAVLLAGLGVAWLTIDYGTLPWVSLALPFSFAFYGLIRKVVDVGPLVGLTVETLLMAIPATIYLGYLGATGEGAFLHSGRATDLLLIGTALMTALPLLLFNLGAKALSLSTIGFIQYLAPTCTFLLAVFYFKEPLDPSLVRTFVLIWSALALVTWDSIATYRAKDTAVPAA